MADSLDPPSYNKQWNLGVPLSDKENWAAKKTELTSSLEEG